MQSPPHSRAAGRKQEGLRSWMHSEEGESLFSPSTQSVLTANRTCSSTCGKRGGSRVPCRVWGLCGAHTLVLGHCGLCSSPWVCGFMKRPMEEAGAPPGCQVLDRNGCTPGSFPGLAELRGNKDVYTWVRGHRHQGLLDTKAPREEPPNVSRRQWQPLGYRFPHPSSPLL